MTGPYVEPSVLRSADMRAPDLSPEEVDLCRDACEELWRELVGERLRAVEMKPQNEAPHGLWPHARPATELALVSGLCFDRGRCSHASVRALSRIARIGMLAPSDFFPRW
jgi:hypothetical protein